MRTNESKRAATKRTRRATVSGKTLLLPAVVAWREIFASESVRVDLSPTGARLEPVKTWTCSERKSVTMTLSRYANVTASGPVPALGITDEHGARAWLDVMPTPAAIEAIDKRAIFIDYDTLYWDVCVWDDGHTLITYKHNAIIGGAWVAIVDSATIPAAVRAALVADGER